MILSLYEKEAIISSLRNKANELKKQEMNRFYQLQHTKEINSLLKDVVHDYKEKYKYIISLKKQQQQQIGYLIHYIEKSMQEAGISEYKLHQAKIQKQTLLTQLQKIKKDLDELVIE